jgi:hypothetical protein
MDFVDDLPTNAYLAIEDSGDQSMSEDEIEELHINFAAMISALLLATAIDKHAPVRSDFIEFGLLNKDRTAGDLRQILVSGTSRQVAMLRDTVRNVAMCLCKYDAEVNGIVQLEVIYPLVQNLYEKLISSVPGLRDELNP